MSKKKRRKPSKAEIRKAWSENRRRENRRKGAVEAEERRHEQWEAKYIASADPDEEIPWCKNCRAHTYYDTEMVWGVINEKDIGGEYRERIGKVRKEQCVLCKGKVMTPAHIKSEENTIFFVSGVIPLLFLAMFIVGFTDNGIVTIGFLIPVTLSILGLGYCAYRGQLSPSYHSWLQWAKERKETI